MKKAIPFITGLAGVVLIVHSQGNLAFDKAEADTNFLELKGSPYGEVIGMALQDPVHLLWHGGQGHEHLHGDHGHDHPHGDHDHPNGDHDHSHDGHTGHDDTEHKPFLIGAKDRLLKMEAHIRQFNDPKGRMRATVHYEHQRVLDLTQLAYDMDPTNYGNYNSLSFFYNSSPLYKGDRRAAVDELAKQTIEACENTINVDPEDSLTSASAVLNRLQMDAEGLPDERYDELKEDYDLMVHYLRHFEKVYEEAYQDGRLESYTQEKLDGWIKYFKRFNYMVEGYDKKIKAALKMKAASNE